jgi:hypothetical protein
MSGVGRLPGGWLALAKRVLRNLDRQRDQPCPRYQHHGQSSAQVLHRASHGMPPNPRMNTDAQTAALRLRLRALWASHYTAAAGDQA